MNNIVPVCNKLLEKGKVRLIIELNRHISKLSNTYSFLKQRTHFCSNQPISEVNNPFL